MSVFDLSSLRQSLPSPSPPNNQPPQSFEPVTITALSWNINGSTLKGRAQCRNLLVPQVAAYVNPDLLLLQEVPSDKIVNFINWQCLFTRRRNYQPLNAGNRRQARILYDCNVFEPCIEPSIAANLNRAVDEAFLGEREMHQIWQTVYAQRVAVVPLRHRITGNVIVFMSFHNTRWGRTMAKKFCQIVTILAKHQKTLVVAGADLNCDRDLFTPEDAHIPYIPEYSPTWRREEIPIVDHIITAFPDGMSVRPDVSCTALDIFPQDDGDTVHAFYNIFNNLKSRHWNYSLSDYMSALNHDPIVCTIDNFVPGASP